MPLKLMYITNNPSLAIVAESAGVDYIFIDMEYIGKDERQKGLNSVKNHHTISDIKEIKKVISSSKILVRINPIHSGSKNEIDEAIKAGADVLMLPFFRTYDEVFNFIKFVNKRCKTFLLLETSDAVNNLDEILKIKDINGIHIGLNDLSICYKKKFMFELLGDDTIDKICEKIKGKCEYGFGGIASIGAGAINSELIIKEHYRLGSSMAILSRSFFDQTAFDGSLESKSLFISSVKKIREFEKTCSNNFGTKNANKRDINKAIKTYYEKNINSKNI